MADVVMAMNIHLGSEKRKAKLVRMADKAGMSQVQIIRILIDQADENARLITFPVQETKQIMST